MIPGISRRDFYPSFYKILSEMLLSLALHTDEVSIFCHVNIICT
jgi:hypothetical protein